MTRLPLPTAPADDCWNRIGVTGDRSCPELTVVIHCRNCPMFAAAGRRFLDALPPAGYQEEWTQRLAVLPEEPDEKREGLLPVLTFRLGEEWLALPVAVLVEVTSSRPVHRIPHRGGLLAGLVNVRGELLLCAHLDRLLGIAEPDASAPPAAARTRNRLLVVQTAGTERWVLPVDEVDQVQSFAPDQLREVPITLERSGQDGASGTPSAGTLMRGVLDSEGRAIGFLNEERLFGILRARVR
jgi:chemotaxis-related protein WspD